MEETGVPGEKPLTLSHNVHLATSEIGTHNFSTYYTTIISRAQQRRAYLACISYEYYNKARSSLFSLLSSDPHIKAPLLTTCTCFQDYWPQWGNTIILNQKRIGPPLRTVCIGRKCHVFDRFFRTLMPEKLNQSVCWQVNMLGAVVLVILW
jgi:hypothetical protein